MFFSLIRKSLALSCLHSPRQWNPHPSRIASHHFQWVLNLNVEIAYNSWCLPNSKRFSALMHLFTKSRSFHSWEERRKNRRKKQLNKNHELQTERLAKRSSVFISRNSWKFDLWFIYLPMHSSRIFRLSWRNVKAWTI